MTRKFFRFLSGTFARQAALGVAAFVLAGAPMLSAHAQKTTQLPGQNPAQTQGPTRRPAPGFWNLTQAQLAEIQRGMERILTPAQKAQVVSAQRKGLQPGQVPITLSDAQKTEMRNVLERVLTPEQKQQLQRLN